MKINACWMIGIGWLFFVLSCKNEQMDLSRLEKFPIRTELTQKRNLEDTLTLVGTIKALDEATLFSRVPGKLLQNLVQEGDVIKKGFSVALVERDEVGVKFESAPVPSSLTGVVARMYLDRGANVTLTTPIALVVDQHYVFVKADIPERYAGRVAIYHDVYVKVDAYPDRVFQGKVSRLSPVVDVSTRSTYMEAKLNNASNLLRSGMFAKLSIIITKRENVISVPLTAFVQNSNSVFVVNDNHAKLLQVEVGLRTDQYAEILQGLSEGQPVITFGLIGLKDGSPVEVLP